MPKLYYPNCSELIADFHTKSPREFFVMVSRLGKKYDWIFDPPLSLRALKELIYRKRLEMLGALDTDLLFSIEVMDKKGNRTRIEYGSNDYDNTLGFRFDSGCNHVDSSQFEFFDLAIQESQAEIKCYDGGSLDCFEKWKSEKYG